MREGKGETKERKRRGRIRREGRERRGLEDGEKEIEGGVDEN